MVFYDFLLSFLVKKLLQAGRRARVDDFSLFVLATVIFSIILDKDFEELDFDLIC